MAQVIQIPTINDTAHDFERLFAIWSQVNDYRENVRFDFSHCVFLRPNAVAFLGGLARLIEWRFGSVEFDWGTCTKSSVMTNLCQNGFAGTFGHPTSAWTGNSIPYREDEIQDMDGITDYLAESWLGRGWVHVSHLLRNAIVGHMWEIYNNAFEHSGSKIGVFSCGQHFRRNNELILSVVDFGQGIPAKVRNFLSSDPRAEQLTAASCLRWAFQSGNSTCTGDIARGLGLDLLRKFIRLNQGKLEVYGNNGYVIIDKNGDRYENRGISFEGTLVYITLRCDENLYSLKGE